MVEEPCDEVGVLHLIGPPTGAQHDDDGPPRPPRGSDCSFAAPSPSLATICDLATGSASSTPFAVTAGGPERRSRGDSRPRWRFRAGSTAMCYDLRLISVRDARMGGEPGTRHQYPRAPRPLAMDEYRKDPVPHVIGPNGPDCDWSARLSAPVRTTPNYQHGRGLPLGVALSRLPVPATAQRQRVRRRDG